MYSSRLFQLLLAVFCVALIAQASRVDIHRHETQTIALRDVADGSGKSAPSDSKKEDSQTAPPSNGATGSQSSSSTTTSESSSTTTSSTSSQTSTSTTSSETSSSTTSSTTTPPPSSTPPTSTPTPTASSPEQSSSPPGETSKPTNSQATKTEVKTETTQSKTSASPSATTTDKPVQDGASTPGMSAKTRNTVIGVVVGVGGAIVLGALAVVAFRIWGRKKQAEESDGLMDYNASSGVEKSEPRTSGGGSGSQRNPFQSTLENYHQPTGPVNASANF